jgi:Ca2+-binding RTX toxin-like protein
VIGVCAFRFLLEPSASLRIVQIRNKEGRTMRRAVLMVATMALTLLVASGVALAVTKIGTNGPDTLRGTNGADNLLGKGANDRLFSLAGRDTLLGGPGKDLVFGGRIVGSCCQDNDFSGGDKNLDGGPGNDEVDGGRGSDNILGSRGNDLLFEGAEPDVAKIDDISAGAGNDGTWVLNWSPVGKDVLSCGSGFDRVLADRTDVIAADCERVFFGRRNIDAYFPSFPESFFEGLP